MKADVLVRGISQLVTAEGATAKHGKEMRDLRIIPDAAIACADGRFIWIGEASEWGGEAIEVLDAGGRA